MRLIGRWERVRPVGAGGVGAAYFLDRKWATLTPVGGEDGWWKSPAGVWRRVAPCLYDEAGVVSGSLSYWPMTVGIPTFAAAGQTTLALDSAYTYNSAGDAVASRLIRRTAATLTSAYVFITAYTGTAANVNDLNFEFRDNGTTKPGSTLHASATVDPASATGWIAFSGLSYAAAAGVYFYAIVGDADGNGTDFATALNQTNSMGNGTALAFDFHAVVGAYRTTGGWASGITGAGAVGVLATGWSDGSTIGNVFTAVGNSTGSTNQKGLRIGDLSAPVRCFGMMASATNPNMSGLNVWRGDTGPAGAPEAGYSSTTVMYTHNTTGNEQRGYIFATPPVLHRGPWRLVFTYSASSNLPNRAQIGTGADAVLRAAMFGGGTWYWAEANGTTDWSNDNTSSFPNVSVLLEDLFGYPYVGAGMAGGMRG